MTTGCSHLEEHKNRSLAVTVITLFYCVRKIYYWMVTRGIVPASGDIVIRNLNVLGSMNLKVFFFP